MSTLPPPPELPDGPEPHRVNASQRPEALGVLLTGRPRRDDPTVAQFLRYAAEHRFSLEHLWVSRDGQRSQAAVLIVPGAGKTGVLFVSPVNGRTGVSHVSGLIRHALSQIQPGDIRLVQALLDPGERLVQDALAQANCEHLAELIYMQGDSQNGALDTTMQCGTLTLTALPWSESRRELFGNAITASYQDTLDCPGLLGVRDIDDIIDGHLSTGRPEPGDWTVWMDGDQPAAVLLVAESAAKIGYELVYLGVAKPYRGKGLGRKLMCRALRLAHQCASRRLFLAVDAKNTPAVALYRDLGFRASTRKTAWVYVVQ